MFHVTYNIMLLYYVFRICVPSSVAPVTHISWERWVIFAARSDEEEGKLNENAKDSIRMRKVGTFPRDSKP